MADARVENPYLAIARSRLRSQLQYRTSFTLDLSNSVVNGVVEFVEIYALFHNVPFLGGLDLTGALLVFAFANLSFSLADLVVGHLDTIPAYLRAGTLDVLLLRPLPVLGQLVLTDIALKRIGRGLLATVVLVIVLLRLPIAWTPAHAALVVLTPLTGGVIFAATFITAGALQFRLVDGAEFANGFTYGGAFAAQYPTSVYPLPLRVLYTFVVPAAFTAYLPTLVILDRAGPPGLPTWLGWCTVPAAAAALTASLLFWRSGVRHYQGGGG